MWDILVNFLFFYLFFFLGGGTSCHSLLFVREVSFFHNTRGSGKHAREGKSRITRSTPFARDCMRDMWTLLMHTYMRTHTQTNHKRVGKRQGDVARQSRDSLITKVMNWSNWKMEEHSSPHSPPFVTDVTSSASVLAAFLSTVNGWQRLAGVDGGDIHLL